MARVLYTVGSLIAELQKFPPEARIAIEDPYPDADAPPYLRHLNVGRVHEDKDGAVMIEAEYP